jgi:hypothetical protein
MQERAKRRASTKIQQRGMLLSPRADSLMSAIIAKVFVLHLAGDEQVDDELEENARQLAAELDSPVDALSKEFLILDMYPPDNNVELKW